MNALASQFWEGQIRTASKDGGDARFLFENTGSTYYDEGFEMLQVLEDHYRPSSISNTFTTLLSLFNDKQSDTEGSGLGLAIAREMITRMVGVLDIVDEGPNRLNGTTVRVFLFHDPEI